MIEILQAIIYVAAFVVIWYASGLIIASVERLAHRLNLSPFAASFFLLGILSSLPEFSVGINSLISHEPEIFVGNLIGATIVLFLFVIPVLAIFGNGIQITHQLNEKDLIFALMVIVTPVFLIADNLVTRTEGVFLIAIYAILIYFIEKKKGLLERIKDKILFDGKSFIVDLYKTLFAMVVIFIASKYIVDQTIVYSEALRIPVFLVSILFLSLGTNLPELSIALRAILMGKKNIAFGDYIGSASANTLIFGILTLLNRQRINIQIYSFKTMLIMLIGLGFFYLFSRTKNDISRKEGLILFFFYMCFIAMELCI
ncbi:MAG: hypothetical protein WC489_01070 [Patescibacteria group bacterium]